MVTQTIQFEAPSLREIGSGTITAELFQGSVSKGTLSAISEDGTRPGRFTGTVTDKPAGDYDLQVRFNGFTVSEPGYSVALLLTVGTYIAAMPSPSGGLTPEQEEKIDSIAVALAGSAPVEPTGRIAAGGKVTAYIGDDFKVRSGTELPIPVNDSVGALKAKLEAIGIENLFFGAAPKDGPAGAIAGTVASITAAGGITTISIEITNCGADLMPGSMPYQIQQSQPQGAEYDDFVEIEGTLILNPRTVRPRG